MTATLVKKRVLVKQPYSSVEIDPSLKSVAVQAAIHEGTFDQLCERIQTKFPRQRRLYSYGRDPRAFRDMRIAFYNGDMFPDEYHNQIFIAEHGSWNRSEKIGYRVSLVRLDEAGKRVLSYEPFIEGWLDGDQVFGRPADVLVAPDGSLLVSDDKAGKIYRVTYGGVKGN